MMNTPHLRIPVFFRGRPWPVLLLLLASFLMACEKEVDIVPDSLPPKLVVEATIESGRPPLVFLTSSLNYFSSLSLNDLSNSFVRNASISISDGSRTVRLKEYSRTVENTSFYFYTVDSANPAAILIGQLNTRYTMRIEAEGAVYTAETTIPALRRTLDSLWWKPAPSNPDTSLVAVFLQATDPPGYGNYVRYFTSVNDSAYLPGLNSVFDDLLVDGSTYQIQVFRGQDRNQDIDQDSFGFFRRGQKVKVKLTNIDKATFDFWRTWEQNQANLGNPFAVPIRVLGNISHGAIGYFGGYAVQERTLNIPK
jgi:hypothetical protein